VTREVLTGPPLPPGARPKVLLSWSTGKDCAWTLHVLRTGGRVDVVGLLTTINDTVNRVSMHAVRVDVAAAVAAGVGLPVWEVRLPSPCSNELYEARMAAVLVRAQEEGIRYVAFGDIHLADVRAYRLQKMAAGPVQPLFPIWSSAAGAPALARRMLDGGIRAVLTCVDLKVLPASFVGRRFDDALLADLPPGVCPLGENGEFHTLCVGGPHFHYRTEGVSGDGGCPGACGRGCTACGIRVKVLTDEPVLRDGLAFVDAVLAETEMDNLKGGGGGVVELASPTATA
jgi:diphthamide synthase (EF-2-diphthine--ammonia ligase)